MYASPGTYAVYRGTLPAPGGMAGRGQPYDHADFGQCDLVGEAAEVAAGEGSYYFLVVSRCAAEESSYGRSSDDVERPEAAPPCP